ncbi:hypothetical protein [Cohnella boryungensis]|uniref:Uncharacterized protein n=1 Tax=Cohnella boryungensis TaxID=768479 RepID=A0ABV8S6T1_9BACL
MNEKKLPIGQTPIRCYQYIGIPLSIMTSEKQSWAWVHSNFIQLHAADNLKVHVNLPILFTSGNIFLDMDYCPWLYRERIGFDVFVRFEIGVVPFLIDSLDKDIYVCLIVDEFYLPHTVHYLQTEFFHEMLVTGYDYDRKCFHTLGYNKQGQFAPAEVTFASMQQAFQEVAHKPGKQLWQSSVCRFRIERTRGYEFDLEFVIDSLKDYVASDNRCSSKRMYSNPVGTKYGMAVYDKIVEHLSLMQQGELRMDIRPLHLIWEHKKCMTARLRYMSEEIGIEGLEPMREPCDKIEKLAFSARNEMMRGWMKGDKSGIPSILKTIEELRLQERPIVEQLIEKLEASDAVRLV